MNFFLFLKSLESLLYEVMSWLVFYPVTLWRTIRHPIRMMDYVSGQLSEGVEAPYQDALSPAIFLLLTVLLAHGIEISLIGESRILADTERMAGLVNNDTSLILMRLTAFATFPVILATNLVRGKGQVLDRETLEEPFHEQCYATAPYALAFSLAATLSQMGGTWAPPLAAALLVLATLAWLVFQTKWFGTRLGISMTRGFWRAVISYVECLAVFLALVWLFGGKDM